MMQLILSLVVLTVLAAGAGGAFALLVLTPPAAETPAGTHGVKTSQTAHRVAALPTIHTNLKGEDRLAIRLDASVVVDSDIADMQALSAKLAEDFLAYLRTLQLTDIQGASGLQFLRSDLVARARIRALGRVHDVTIQTLLVE